MYSHERMMEHSHERMEEHSHERMEEHSHERIGNTAMSGWETAERGRDIALSG